MMHRYIVFIVGFFLSVIITSLFQISESVRNHENRLKTVRAEILKEQEKIRVYKSEWTYLTRPERLRKMAEAFTYLTPQSERIRVPISHIPFPPDTKTVADTRQNTDTPDFSSQVSDLNSSKRIPVSNSSLSRSRPYGSSVRVSVSFKDVWGGRKP